MPIPVRVPPQAQVLPFAPPEQVPENADLRPVFMEHSDYTNLVEAPNENVLLDVNFPNDIDKLKNK